MAEPASPLEPWWLPGLAPSPAGGEAGGAGWHAGRTVGGLGFRTPRLNGPAAARVADSVREAALAARRERPLDRVVAAASRAARALADRQAPAGAHATDLLARELGWTEELAAETLAGMAEIWSEDALRSLIEAELGDPGLLEDFRPAPGPGVPGRRRRAAGPPLLFCVLAANVPGVSVTAILRGLLVRSGVLCRAPSDAPSLPALFARTLAEEDPLLGRTVATTWWPIDEGEPWASWVKRTGKVVVYGGEEAVAGVRDRIPPYRELVAYGPRIGVGIVLPDAAEGSAADDAAEGLARDACAYEQQGCVSPRLVYVVGEAGPFATRLARALEAETARVPRPAPVPEEAVAIRSLRAEMEFGGYGEGGGSSVLGAADLAWTVAVVQDPAPVTETLRRVVRVCPIGSPAELEEALRPLEGRVQAIAYAGADGLPEVAEAALRLGVSRVARLGTAAWPPADWRHDGRHQLVPLLNWTDWEA